MSTARSTLYVSTPSKCTSIHTAKNTTAHSECISLLFSQIDFKKGSDVQLRVISISSGFNRRMGNLFRANVIG